MLNLDDARESFVSGYREAMLWANAYHETIEDVDGRDYADLEDVDRTDADTFWDSLGYVIAAIPYYKENGMAYAGRDFALTRNRHGAGFWDRGLGEIGNMLSDEATAYGSHNVIIEVDDNDDILSTYNEN